MVGRPYLEFLIAYPAEGQGRPVGRGQLWEEQVEGVGEELFPLLPEPRPLP